jgi:His-Xaa-Ser system protein HxsD
MDDTMTASATAGVSFRVDTSMYPISAVTRAAYKFTARYHVAIRREAEDSSIVTVTLTPKSPSILDATAERVLMGDFENELIDQRLRESLEAEFGALRELIVAHAFSDTNLLDPARDDGDYVEDPLGIGLPGPQPTAASNERPRT